MTHRQIPLLFALALPLGCATETAPPQEAPEEAAVLERHYVNPRTAADADLPPFSGGVMVGDTFYVAERSGCSPTRPYRTPPRRRLASS